MFSTKITEKAAFLRMPLTTQALYFHLGINADDDGIVEAFKILRMTGANEDDLKVLATKQFIKILNEDLVAYILDWNEHNLIRADRKQDSIYQGLLIKVLPEVKIKKPIERADVKKKKWTSTGQPKDGIREVKLREVKLSKEKKENTLGAKCAEANEILNFYKETFGFKKTVPKQLENWRAAKWLFDQYGVERTCQAILAAKSALEDSVAGGEKVPIIKNLMDLKEKYDQLRAYYGRKRSRENTKIELT